jgi:hypothetical protein
LRRFCEEQAEGARVVLAREGKQRLREQLTLAPHLASLEGSLVLPEGDSLRPTENTEFYNPKFLFKYKHLQIRHYDDDLDVFHDYLYFIDYLFEEFDSVINDFLYN